MSKLDLFIILGILTLFLIGPVKAQFFSGYDSEITGETIRYECQQPDAGDGAHRGSP